MTEMDVPAIYKDVDCISKIEGIVALIEKDEESINNDLHKLLAKQCQIESKMKGISRAINKVNTVDKDAKKLDAQIVHTAQLAESVSAKVRRLDLARCRVSDCQQRVHDLIDLQLCSQGVVKAISEEEYEVGAGHINRFLAMDLQLLKQTADDVQGSENSVCEAIRTLESATGDMRNMILQRFDEAVKKDDLASVERFFKIFPLLGRHQEGIEKFSQYICIKLKVKNEKNLRNNMDMARAEKRVQLAYADAMTSVLENFARFIEINQPIVESYYGYGYLVEMLHVLQRQCDSDVGKLLASYNTNRKIDTKKQQIKDACLRNTNSISSGPSGLGHYRKASGGSVDKLNPKDIDALTVEITVMHSRIELYFRFMKRRTTSDIEACSAEKPTQQISLTRLHSILSKSELSRQMQELLGTYLLFERRFFHLRQIHVKKLKKYVQGTLVKEKPGTENNSYL